MKVCIAEKPSVAGDIARILGAKTKKNGYWEGNGYQVTWTFGHLCTLKMPDDYRPEWKRWTLESLPMLPKKFEIKLIQTKNKKASSGIKSQFAIIKKLFQKATEIINCGDAGQEGELIQRWVLQHTRCRKPVKRLWISSLTKEAIKNGFSNLQPASQYDALFAAGRSRAICDWLLGMNASRLYTLKYGGYKQVLSIGRVQTPTLALVVKRNHEIENFKPETYWELHTTYRKTTFQSEKGKFKQKEAGEKCLNQVKDKPFTILSVSQKKAKEKPPYLFDLTSLQIYANKRFGYSADFTLQQIQKLYEKKIVTYPRVDTTYLPNDMYGKIGSILSKMTDYQEFTQSLLSKPIQKSKKVFNNTKVTDHHAIIPTGVAAKSLSNAEKNMYDAIARRFIAAFYPDCLVNHTTVIGEAGGIKFKTTGKQILEEGWRVLYPKRVAKTNNNNNKNTLEKDKKANTSNKKEEKILPIFKQGESGEHEPELLEKQTQPPKDYTEATLLQGMETAGKTVEDEALRALMKANGIGRPSTRANIIETLCRRNYIRRAKKKLLPTTTGTELIGIIKNDLLKSAELTGKWEAKLRDIEDGKYGEKQFLSEMESMIKQMVQEVLNDKTNRKITAIDSQNNYKKGNFKEKKGFQIERKSKAKTARKTTTKNIDKKETKTQKNDLVNCPKCSKGFILKGKAAYGCSNYKSGCDFVVPFVFHKKKLSENQVFTLIKKGKSRLLKGFVFDGEKIAARVVLDKDCYLLLEAVDNKTSDNFEKTLKNLPNKTSEAKNISKKKKTVANENPFCPKCKKGHIVKGKTAYGCSLWKSGCDFRFPFALIREKAAGRPLTKELVMEIISFEF